MFAIKTAAPAVSRVSMTMPLLTELVSTNAGFCYQHGAPNGASAGFVPLENPQHSRDPSSCRQLKPKERPTRSFGGDVGKDGAAHHVSVNPCEERGTKIQ